MEKDIRRMVNVVRHLPDEGSLFFRGFEHLRGVHVLPRATLHGIALRPGKKGVMHFLLGEDMKTNRPEIVRYFIQNELVDVAFAYSGGVYTQTWIIVPPQVSGNERSSRNISKRQ
jgi:hypothetical protein